MNTITRPIDYRNPSLSLLNQSVEISEISEDAMSVASNDTQIEAAKPKESFFAITKDEIPVLCDDATYLETMRYVKELKTVRRKWESSINKASNDALYLLLAECHSILLNQDIHDINSALRRCIEDDCKLAMTKMQKNTTLESKVVRVIFDNQFNRKRIHCYSVVLQEAKRQSIKSADLADWIRLYGGVEEIRLNSKPDRYKTAPMQIKKPLTKEQKEEQKRKDAEQMKANEAALDRLFDCGLLAYSDNDVTDSKSDAAIDKMTTESDEVSNRDLSCAASSNATASSDKLSEQADDFLAEQVKDAAHNTNQKNEINRFDEHEERVCIAYKRKDGTYDVRWEIENSDVRGLAIGAFRMERHGVSTEFDLAKAAFIGNT